MTEALLPDWWDDSLSSVPANRLMAEVSIARMLGLQLSQLSDPKQSVSFPLLDQFRLKHSKRSKPKEIAPSILVAEQAGSVLSRSVRVPAFTGPKAVGAVRQEILETQSAVSLNALLNFAWSAGIVVFHLKRFPKKAKKFAGLAMFCEGTPVIALASARDGAPWIAFHLAHELGHILLGHVTQGSGVLVDMDLDAMDDDVQEREADRFACELLTGFSAPQAQAQSGMTAERLVQAVGFQSKKLKADPGVVALFYGRNAKRMAVAQSALNRMGLHAGAHAMVQAALESRLVDEPSELANQFLALTRA